MKNLKVWNRAQFFVMAVLAFGTGAVQAQMFKCVGPGGKVEYRGSPCEDARHERGLSGGTISGVDAMSQKEIQRAQRANPAPRQPQAVIIGGQAKGPSAQDIKNMEAAATSVTMDPKARKFLEAEVRRAKEAQRRGGDYTAEDWADLKEAQRAQNRIDDRDRKKARRDGEDIHLGAGSDAVKAGILQEREAEAARAAARRAAAVPLQLTNCDAGGCWDTSGNRYNRAAGAGNFFRQDGKSCTTVADRVRCD